MKTAIEFKETQFSYILLSFLALFIGIIALSGYQNKGGWTIILLLVAILVAVFYKLTTVIDDYGIAASFGIGFLSRRMNFQEMDVSTIQLIDIPWYYGIGIRYTSTGIIYNTKHNKAIRIVSKDRKKVFLVGTDHYEEIRSILLQKNN
ncbi:hypothetical protein [Capnocytophaga sp. oral taxon 323]|uniref:hypothetical protein n=1 Tax=Capnocytophaga sp. oral taxon 323 TaxID=1705617 RepID=UPI0006ADE4C4|nr:hypothetical protein [Capnocytophaga sp. oral taxon 323]ALC98194.1 hypothetical protein AM608_02435 [Capnocytophaga sp. oral taxon 323]